MNWKTLAASSRLFWKLSAAFLLILVLLGVGYIFITSYTAGRYLQEVNQRLYGSIAKQLVKETHPLVNGKPDTAATHDIMHSMMVINPSVEVYLTDTAGLILDYVVPNKSVHLKKVSVAPIRAFIADDTGANLKAVQGKRDAPALRAPLMRFDIARQRRLRAGSGSGI